MKEVKEGRYAGPFDQPPFDNHIQSPIGLVPKSGGKTWLIFHLSYDFGKMENEKSLNYWTPADKCSVKYKDIDFAIKHCINLLNWLGWDTNDLYFSKTDLLSAFRQVPCKPDSWKWLLLKAENPVTNKIQFFVDKCLPFGSSISCSHFQAFSDALAHIFEYLMGNNRRVRVTNYLDDFLFTS